MFNFEKLKEKIYEIEKSNLIENGDKILLAFSGGPDSVFLYRVLSFFQKKYSLELALMYVNHNLRDDVEKDLGFVKRFSEENSVQLYTESVNVYDYSSENRKSTELAARELRYSALTEKANNAGYDKIATGHNLDDNIETFIFRLLRGTSIKGLKGIPEKRENIIRPILSFEKKEILDCLKANNEEYIKDYTNEQSDYTRNYIRNEIFPMFLKINPNFRRKINELILEIKNKKNGENKKNNFVKYLEKNNIEINRRKIDQIYSNIFDEEGNIDKKGTREFDLGKNRFLRKEYGNIEIVEKTEISENQDNYIKILKINQSIEWYNYQVYLYDKSEINNRLFFKKNGVQYTFLEFSDIDHKEIIIRKRKEGDTILLNNLGHKKVKKILIDEKIPKHERDEIPVIECKKTVGNSEMIEILAVGDIKISEHLKKVKEEEINTIEKGKMILIIGRKNGR